MQCKQQTFTCTLSSTYSCLTKIKTPNKCTFQRDIRQASGRGKSCRCRSNRWVWFSGAPAEAWDIAGRRISGWAFQTSARPGSSHRYLSQRCDPVATAIYNLWFDKNNFILFYERSFTYFFENQWTFPHFYILQFDLSLYYINGVDQQLPRGRFY